MQSDMFDDLYQEAMRYYAQGLDDDYIYFQLADKGVEAEKIDEVLVAIKKFRKKGKRSDGFRNLLIGLSTIAIGFGLMWYINNATNSPYAALAWGIPVMGLMIMAKGLVQLSGL